MSTSILLGAILTFGSSDGETLQLTVSLTRAATVSLDWGNVARTSSTAGSRHLFRGLDRPHEEAIEYVLSIAGEAPHKVAVGPFGQGGRLRVAVYGDSREGSTPHRMLIRAIARADVDVVVHTGDLVLAAADEEGWVRHLSAMLPVSERTPVILALGNHELADLEGRPGVDGLARAMKEIPPPDDPLARSVNAPAAAFHVRVDGVVFVSLDSNQPLDAESDQFRFLERVLEEKDDARHVVVVYHQGPQSSGPHGPHPDAEDIIRLLEKHRVTLSIAGHDHVYERIVRSGITYVVSGGGGAPLYTQARFTSGSQAFAATYNWVMIDLARDRAGLEAFSLEGATLDRASVVPPPALRPRRAETGRPLGVIASLVLLASAFGYALLRVAREQVARQRGSR